MPRQVDHDARRAAVARVFRRLLDESGPAATTFARVAAAAGVSVGLIQYYFADRAALLRFAHEDGSAQVLRRVDDRVAAGERAHEPIVTMVLGGLEQLLPLDDTRRHEYQVGRYLRAEAQHDPTLATVADVVVTGLIDRLRQAVANGKHCGEVAADVDEHAAAVRLLAVADGLATIVHLRGHRSPPTASAALVAPVLGPVVATVFTGRCRRHESGSGAR